MMDALSSNPIRPLLRLNKALIMGVINITPDSFSDGGNFSNTEKALAHGLSLIEQGADILDIGGESTRPGADKVSVQEELDRVLPVIEALVNASNTAISIDTSKPQVMQAAVKAGASMVNDVNGLQTQGAIDLVAQLKVPVCIMHMQGQPQTMQVTPTYESAVNEVNQFFTERISEALDAGIQHSDIILDPGIGFGKNLQHNLQLLHNTSQFCQQHDCPILIGVSRKSLIDMQLNRTIEQRLPASIGLAVQAVLNGAKIVRVHDVRETFDAVRMAEAVRDV